MNVIKRGDLVDIQVWSVDSNAAEVDISLLPREERRRAEFLPESRRQLYLATRVALWQLLASVLGGDPSHIRIDRRCRHCGDRGHGKPTVGDTADEVDFSVSYSTKAALVAVGLSVRVGVDIQDSIEGSRPHRWFFSPFEQSYLARLDSCSRDVALTHAWARKEALAKADGRGLAFPLSRIVATGPSSLWKLPSRQWQLKDLDVGEGLAGAVAYDVPSARVQFTSWVGSLTESKLPVERIGNRHRQRLDCPALVTTSVG